MRLMYNENKTIKERKDELEKSLDIFKRCPVTLFDYELKIKHDKIVFELKEIEELINNNKFFYN